MYMEHSTEVWGKGLMGKKKIKGKKKKEIWSPFIIFIVFYNNLCCSIESGVFVLEITPFLCTRKYIKYSKAVSFSSPCSRESGVKFSTAVIPTGVILIHY